MKWRFKGQKAFNPEPVYAAAKHKWPKWQWYTLLVVVTIPLLYIIGRVLLSWVFVTAPGLIVTDTILLNAPDQAYVATIPVHVGEPLSKGEVVLTLSVPGLEAKKEFLASQITRLTKLQKDDQNQEGEALMHAQRVASESAQSANTHYQVFKDYNKRGLLSVIDMHAAEHRYRQANVELHKINVALTQNQQQYALRVTERKTKIGDLQHQLVTLTQQMALYALTSPVNDGVLSQLLVQPHEYVTDGQNLAVISTPNHLAVKALFDTKALKKLVIGTKVYIILPDYQIIRAVIAVVPLATEAQVSHPLLANPHENKVVVMLEFIEPLPEKYHTSGIEVKVLLQRLDFRRGKIS